MSKDNDKSQSRYYIKQLDRKATGAPVPNWCVYERLPRGSNAVCLCYDEQTAQLIMGLLEVAQPKMQGQDDLQP